MNYIKFFTAVVICSFFLSSCTNDDNVNPEVPLGNYDNGVLVLNQGLYEKGDATMSYISNDFSTMQNDIFSLVNPTITLGDTGQDVGFQSEYAYVILNVSNKIQIVNRYTMQNVASISSGLNNPRYIAFANGKGYVTNWADAGNPNDDYVAVIDLNSNTVTNKIPVGEGPERIIENAGKLYVAQLGGWDFGNTITVIDASNNTVSATITVGDLPNAMQIKDSFLWVSCGGNPSYVVSPLVETSGKLVRVNLANNQVTNTFGYSDAAKHISNLVINENNAYYTSNSGVYKFGINGTNLPENPAFDTATQGVYDVYSFAINNNSIFVGDAGNYKDNGKVYIYSMNGTLEKSFTVGVIPGGFYFNE